MGVLLATNLLWMIGHLLYCTVVFAHTSLIMSTITTKLIVPNRLL